MGKADFSAKAVDFRDGTAQVIDYPLDLGDKRVHINTVSMGNPHCVLFAENVDKDTAIALGPKIENHPLFANRTNVQFVKVLDRKNIQIEIWERGAGYTLASGTSSCAAVSLAVKLGYCDVSDGCEDYITVHMPGGKLAIRVNKEFAVTMRGAVTRIGQVEVEQECFD